MDSPFPSEAIRIEDKSFRADSDALKFRKTQGHLNLLSLIKNGMIKLRDAPLVC